MLNNGGSCTIRPKIENESKIGGKPIENKKNYLLFEWDFGRAIH